jgi:Family of unknown function (DUF6088)
MDLKTEIQKSMAAQAPFGVWTPTDFLDLGSRDAIDQALSRMTSAGDIRRITRGLYDLPRPNTLTGKPTNPDPRRIIDALTRRDQARRRCQCNGGSSPRGATRPLASRASAAMSWAFSALARRATISSCMSKRSARGLSNRSAQR